VQTNGLRRFRISVPCAMALHRATSRALQPI